MRTLPGDTEETIIKLIRDNLQFTIDKGQEKYPSFMAPGIEYASDECVTYTGVKIKQTKFAPAWKTGEDAEIVVKATAALEKLGVPVEIGAYSFCTDGSAVVKYREMFPDRNCQIIGFGPSDESLAHTTNEYISIGEMRKAFQGYAGIVSELLMRP